MYKLYYKNKIKEEDINISKTCYKAYLNIGNSYKYINYLEELTNFKNN